MKRHTLALVFTLAVPPLPLQAAPHAHEHGTVKLDVAIDGTALTIGLESPLDSLSGFERAPRNDRERRAAEEALARLRSGAGLFSADAAARCRLAKVEVNAPVLAPGTKPSGKTDETKDEHVDLDASFEYECSHPQLLRTLDVGLFEAFKRIQRIDVQVAGPKGQLKSTLKRPARSVPLQR